MLWNGNLDEVLDRFVSSANADEDKLRAALESVPDDSWWTVWARLDQDMHDEMTKCMPVAQDVTLGKPMDIYVSSEEKNRGFDLAERKKTLLAEEFRKRQQQ